MKTIFKWLGIIVVSLIVIIIAAAIALAMFLPLDKIKEMAAAELTKALHREVKIEKVSFNIFTGLRLEKLSIADLPKNGKRNFISADAIELHYDLWPLLQRKIVIRKMGLAKPHIYVEKTLKGDFNFSDLLAPQKPSEKKQEPAGKLPFKLFINSFYVKNGQITYSDRAAGTTSALNNFNVSVSGFELAMDKPIDFKASSDVLYQGKSIPLALSGKVELALAKEKVSISPLSLSIAGETVNASVLASNFKGGPNISLTLASNKISVDPLLSIFAGPGKKSKPVDMTTSINQITASIPKTLILKTAVNVSNLTFQNFTVDKIDLSADLIRKNAIINLQEIRFYGGKLSGSISADLNVQGLAYQTKGLKLTGFDAHPFLNVIIDTFLTKLQDYKDLKNKLYGKLDVAVSFKGQGVDPKVILKNLSGDARVSITEAEIKKTKILSSVADILRSNSLKNDLKVKEIKADAGIKNSTIYVRRLAFAHNDFKLGFIGGVDLNSLTWVSGNRLTLNLAPQITTGLGKEYSLLRDASGWLEVTFELTGSLKMPIPKPILDKPLENLKKKVEEKAQTAINEEKKKAEITITNKASEEAARLKKEAGNKLKDLIKF